MDRMQVALKLALDVLEIPVTTANYRLICDAAYTAEQKGLYISPSRLLLNSKTGHAYSPMSHEESGCPSRNLYDDVFEMERDIEAELDYSDRFTLEDKAVKLLLELKEELRRK